MNQEMEIYNTCPVRLDNMCPVGFLDTVADISSQNATVNLFSMIFSVIIWHYCYFVSQTWFNNRKLSSNTVSMLHAWSVIINSMYYFLDQKIIYSMILISCGYFIFDSIVQFFYGTNRKMSYGLITHHLLSIYSVLKLTDENYGGYILLALFFAELSNMPKYFTYYAICAKKVFEEGTYERTLMDSVYEFLLGTELAFYIVFRCMFSVYFLPKILVINENIIISAAAIFVSIINIVWTFKLFLQCMAIKNKDSM